MNSPAFSRIFSRYLPRSASAARGSSRANPRSLIQPAIRGSRRGYSSSSFLSSLTSSSTSSSASSKFALSVSILVATGGSAFYYYTHNKKIPATAHAEAPAIFKPSKDDYQEVYDEIARLLVEKDDYDDGSYGPVLVRLAWHCSGTYDAETGTGGSNGATMRFAPESEHGANSGLKHARDFLEPVKAKFPWITYSDLWTLAGITSIQELQGPRIPWRPGRRDRDISFCTPDGRLPDGAKGQSHLRAIFGRMGFDDREIVALSGAHALGRCHPDRSGWDGPWDFSPTVFTNEFFRLLVQEEWRVKEWGGPKQFEDVGTKTLMMLPTDMALMKDEEFRKHVERYAKDEGVFFREFADVFGRLVELGVPFERGQEERFDFRTLEEKDEEEE